MEESMKPRRGSLIRRLALLAALLLAGLYAGHVAGRFRAGWRMPIPEELAAPRACGPSSCAPRPARPDAAPAAGQDEEPGEGAQAPAGPGRWRLVGPIDVTDFAALRGWLKEHLDAGHKTAVMEIDSPGGSVVLAHQMVKALEAAAERGLRVTCVVDGLGLSSAFAILQSCPERWATRRSYLMAHSPYQPEAEVRLETLDNQRSALEVVVRAFAEQCAGRLKVTMDEYLRRTTGGHQWWMDWREALRSGAVDGVVGSVMEIDQGRQSTP